MEFVTEANQKNVVINVASFGNVMALKSMIESTLAKNNIGIQDALESDPLKLFVALDSDLEVHKMLMKCMINSTYDGRKITEETFEDEGARYDYYEVVLSFLKVNLLPFFKGLLSLFKASSSALPTNEQNQE